ncbi:hypothetical protein Tco_0795970 [Tanacetum coccineum]
MDRTASTSNSSPTTPRSHHQPTSSTHHPPTSSSPFTPWQPPTSSHHHHLRTSITTTTSHNTTRRKKEKVIVKKRKGIELLSEVALTEEAQYKKFSRRNEKEVEDDEEEKGDESIKTASNYASTNEEDETIVELKVENKAEGDEDKGMDYTTNQFNDDVDVRLNEPINIKRFIQKEGTDAEMINVKQGNENIEITLNQVIKDAHVTIFTVTKKTKVNF